MNPVGLCDTDLCQAEIRDFDVAVIMQEDISRLDVSVYDLVRMQKLQTTDHFRYEVSNGKRDIWISIANDRRQIKSKDEVTSPYRGMDGWGSDERADYVTAFPQ